MSIGADKVFKALAHEKRLQILAWLKDPEAHFPPQTDGDLIRDGVCVLRIAEKLKVKQPTATRHLQLLASAGLLIPTRIGKWTFFKRNRSMIAQLKNQLFGEV